MTTSPDEPPDETSDETPDETPAEPGRPDEASLPAGPAPAAGPDPDPDAAFRAIVAGFGRSAAGPVPPWPVEEDVEPEQRRAPWSGGRPDAGSEPPRRPAPPAADLPGWVEPAPVEDEHHYVPPPPPPAPRLKPRTVAASAAILLGVLLMFRPSVLDVAPGASTSFFGLLLAGGGAGALVYWMRDAPGIDDGPDDGAVV